MCGIIGYVGHQPAVPRLLTGLKSLEYRGYDSAGIGLQEGNELLCFKEEGRLSNLETLLQERVPPHATCGIGQTRWATHGVPSASNAHPHISHHLALVHNGIIENYLELKSFLSKRGYVFLSQTDTEVATHLIDYYYHGDPVDAIIQAQKRLEGSYAFGIVFANHPDTIYALRKGSPLLVGIGSDGHYIASDMTAILDFTREYFLLEEDEIAVIHPQDYTVLAHGEKVEKEILTAQWNREETQKDGFPHFMLKEIFQQPEVLIDSLHPRVVDGLPNFSADGIVPAFFKKYQKIHIVACGSARHAGLVAKVQMEQWARLPVDVSIASEFRYGNPLVGASDLVVVISQSGETADSLAALRLANSLGIDTLGIVNAAGSSIAREARYSIPTYAGPEISVASTKAFSVQMAVLALFSLNFALERGTLSPEEVADKTAELLQIPPQIEKMLEQHDSYEPIAKKLAKCTDVFFIGRGIDYPISMEGSLKLKEISYLHAESYAAGELKHGAISLIDAGVPVIGLCTSTSLAPKLLSNLKETVARGSLSILIASDAIAVHEGEFDYTLQIPETKDPLLSVFLSVIVMQLLSYYTATAKGCDVDKPRNLAKSVTVE